MYCHVPALCHHRSCPDARKSWNQDNRGSCVQGQRHGEFCALPTFLVHSLSLGLPTLKIRNSTHHKYYLPCVTSCTCSDRKGLTGNLIKGQRHTVCSWRTWKGRYWFPDMDVHHLILKLHNAFDRRRFLKKALVKKALILYHKTFSSVLNVTWVIYS